jgi:DNA uptake protein ComE-like DNA-binding protein
VPSPTRAKYNKARTWAVLACIILAASLAGTYGLLQPGPSAPASQPHTASSTALKSTARPMDSTPVRTVYPGPSGAPAAAVQAPRPNLPAAALVQPPSSVVGQPLPKSVAAEQAHVTIDDGAAGSASPQADGTSLVNLNTASTDELNRLGAGMIGRHLIANRPYSSPHELVTRKVLTKQDFDRIKPNITAR